jgi:hypothetical protein
MTTHAAHDQIMTTPDWWARALALEAEGDVAAAETLLRDAIPHVAFAAQTAELHAHRMRRLQAAGDHDGAARAFADAKRWITFYASLATSGGEGMALSAERDRFLASLRASYDG